MSAGDVHVRRGGHPAVTDRVGPGDPAQPVPLGDALGVAEVLDDLERVAQRQHLAAWHVLHVVGQRLQLAAVAEPHAERVLLVSARGVDLGTELGQPGLDLVPVAFEPVGPAVVADLARVSQLDPHDEQVVRRALQGEAAGVGAAVLHRLKHPGHLTADVAGSVPVDDAGYAAHVVAPSPLASRYGPYGRIARYSPTSQSETVAQ